MSTTDPRSTRAESPTRLTRRTLTLGAAWTAPLVAVSVAAPAYAASCGQSRALTIDWSTSANYSRMSDLLASYVIDPDGAAAGYTPITLSIASVVVGNNLKTGYQYNGTANNNDNMRISTQSVGGGLGRCLTFHQAPINTNNKGTRANRQEITFTFSQPVQNLAFTMADIDSMTGDFWDQIEIERVGGWSRVATSGSVVAGNGTQATPYSPASQNAPADDNETKGNVGILMSGSTTTFKIIYWNSETDSSGNWWNPTDGDQKVFFSNMTGTVKPPGCA